MFEDFPWSKVLKYAFKLKAVIDPILNRLQRLWDRKNFRKYSSKLKETLSSLYPEKAKVNHYTFTIPPVLKVGELEITSEIKEQAKIVRNEILARGDRIEMQAVVRDEPGKSFLTGTWKYDTTDYATVKTLRDSKIPVNVITSGAVVFCSATQEVFIHERNELDTYPFCFHIHGGAFRSGGGADDGDQDLLATCQRELREELGVDELILQPNELPPVAIAQELDTGYVQVVFLGINLNEGIANKVKRIRGEGVNLRIGFDELEGYLNEDKWVPTGKIHFLGWLGLGAPGLSPFVSFGGYKARQLFEHLQKDFLTP